VIKSSEYFDQELLTSQVGPFSMELVLLYGWWSWAVFLLRDGVHLTICHTHRRNWRCHCSCCYYLSLPPQCAFRTRVNHVAFPEQNNTYTTIFYEGPQTFRFFQQNSFVYVSVFLTPLVRTAD
jgi:hypothetical protein